MDKNNILKNPQEYHWFQPVDELGGLTFSSPREIPHL